ncbi:DUF4221 domain-containing protein [Belliella sp. DSM 111904]|uniref:DUF4221 domain-containing protein n=1 Tax=Belliella filtrata TaxID=2923435 RepID=A0ABS9UV22_9BACT|nr:DUF4221 family protein [Belliella filtrata]MCH7407814.1 DUF4221 domain-containing protein [Belliella filtrata]
MKQHTIFALLLCLHFSCSQNTSNDYVHAISYSLDTLVIDSKERNLDLSRNITNASVNFDKDAIYLFNRFDHSIDEINLERLEFVQSIPFQKEGPNGTSYVNYIYALANDLFFIKGSVQSSVFNMDAKLLKKADWSKVNEGEDFQMLRNELTLSYNDSMKVFGLSYKGDRSVSLEILSVNEHTKETVEIDSEGVYQNNILEFDDNGHYYFLDPMVYLTAENGYAIVSHDFSNEMYIFDTGGEQVKKVSYEPTLTPKSVKQIEKEEIVSVEILKKFYQGFLEQIKFSPPVWDQVNKRYLRLSAQRVFTDIKPENAFLPQVKEVKVFLTVFDEDFNLVSEVEVPELDTESTKYFAKEGKLWVFTNMDDEMGFVRISINK